MTLSTGLIHYQYFVQQIGNFPQNGFKPGFPKAQKKWNRLLKKDDRKDLITVLQNS